MQEIEAIVRRESLPDGVSWYASRNEFVVRRVGGKALTDGPVSFRVKKSRTGIVQEDLEEQRRAAIDFWTQRSGATHRVGSDKGIISSSSCGGGDEADQDDDVDGGEAHCDAE